MYTLLDRNRDSIYNCLHVDHINEVIIFPFFSSASFVRLAMDAMDQILVACRTQSLNLFVESFLKTVQQLLESHDPHMQLLATQSVIYYHYYLID